MSIFGIGPFELAFIIIIMLLVLGPQQMVTTARKMGVYIRKIVKSPIWTTIMDTSREIRDIPTRLVREAGLEEIQKDIKETSKSVNDMAKTSVPFTPLSIDKPVPPMGEEPEPDEENGSKTIETPLPQGSQSLPIDERSIKPQEKTGDL
jgi:sec-independent protein translocase protein TatB